MYRQLAACPAMYWSSADDPDALYLKNQRQWVRKYLEENLGGRLDIHKNAAFWMLEEGGEFGTAHPRDAMLPEAVLLICGRIRQLVNTGELVRDEDECIRMSRGEFCRLILELREGWREAWSREFREMDDEKLLNRILSYMKDWMMLKDEEEWVILMPAAGKLEGYYPQDYTGGEKR